jgi:hypothetical protein
LRSPHLRHLGKTLTWGCSSAGRAAALQAVGRRFDSAQLHQFRNTEHDDDDGTARMRKLSERFLHSEGFLIRGDHDL